MGTITTIALVVIAIALLPHALDVLAVILGLAWELGGCLLSLWKGLAALLPLAAWVCASFIEDPAVRTSMLWFGRIGVAAEVVALMIWGHDEEKRQAAERLRSNPGIPPPAELSDDEIRSILDERSNPAITGHAVIAAPSLRTRVAIAIVYAGILLAFVISLLVFDRP